METLSVNGEQRLNLSATALHKVLLLPIIVMALTINAVFGVSWFFERRTQQDSLESHIVAVLNGHATYLSREIFFDRAAAVTGRLSEIVSTTAWNPDGLPARLCLHLVYDPEFNRRQPETVCSGGTSALPAPLESLASLHSIPLQVGDKRAADLYYELSLHNDLGSLLPPKLLWSMGLGILAAVVAYLTLFTRLNDNLIQPAHRRIVKSERLAGIAQFVQITAHDIRKPFSMIRAKIRNLDDAEIQARAKAELLSLVDRELEHVNNMLADVMAIGPIKPKSDPVSAVAVLAKALAHSVDLRERRGVAFSYEMKHTRQIAAEESKVARVFGNIVDNAVQAVDERGSIWIKTRDLESGSRIEFSIGNTGSYVTTEDRERIFEAFFTKGKAGGTGLGLASVASIVEAYGGKIRCESEASAGTTFVFTFPAHEFVEQQSGDTLPKTSDDALTSKAASRAFVASTLSIPSRPLNILLVDDEPIYSEALATMIGSYEPSREMVRTSVADSVAMAIEIAGNINLDLVITDMDFGRDQPDGLSLIHELRQRFPSVRVAVCTNRDGDDFKASVLAAGASAYLSKPVGDAALIALLNNVAACVTTATPSKPQVVFVDDQIAFYIDWSRRFKNIDFHYFNSPESLWARLDGEPAFLERMDAVFTDFNFADESKQDGTDVARRIKALGAKPVYLISNHTENEIASRLERGLFASVLDKNAAAISEGDLLRALKSREGFAVSQPS